MLALEHPHISESLLSSRHFRPSDANPVRVFATYGPRIRADGGYARALSRFIAQALTGRDITVFGEGKQTRSFCYITDTISGILMIAANSRARGQVFNIGNPQEITIMDLAQKVKKLAGSTSRIVHRPLPPDDPQRRCPDISKAKKLLGWSPTVPLDEGLRKTIQWFRQCREASR